MLRKIKNRIKFETFNYISSYVGSYCCNKYDNNPVVINDRLVRKLWSEGFINLGNCDIENKSVSDRINSIFENQNFNRTSLMSINNSLVMEEISEYLYSPVIQNIVFNYLGSDARFDRLWCYRIPDSMNQDGLSGDWHHDRVGKRLKMFVLLHDVGPDDRPMQIIAGSHRDQKRNYGFRASRLNSQLNLSEEKVNLVIGKQGDVIFFDTNSLHRADWSSGRSHRDVLSFEFAVKQKSNILSKFSMPIGVHKTKISSKMYREPCSLIDAKYLYESNKYYYYGYGNEVTTNSFDL